MWHFFVNCCPSNPLVRDSCSYLVSFRKTLCVLPSFWLWLSVCVLRHRVFYDDSRVPTRAQFCRLTTFDSRILKIMISYQRIVDAIRHLAQIPRNYSLIWQGESEKLKRNFCFESAKERLSRMLCRRKHSLNLEHRTVESDSVASLLEPRRYLRS